MGADQGENMTINGRQFYMFGDSAYLLFPWIIRPFLRDLERAEKEEFNTSMSFVRVSVEQNWKDLKQLWTMQDFARNHKIHPAPIGLLYHASTILHNIRVCMYKCGRTAQRYSVEAPTLEVYLTSG